MGLFFDTNIVMRLRMNILEISQQIKSMFKQNPNPSVSEWNIVFTNFENALDACSDVDILVQCILDDNEWDIPFDDRMKLMDKAKDLGADSYEFLRDYYAFRGGFLDPGDEYEEANLELEKLNRKHGSLP